MILLILYVMACFVIGGFVWTRPTRTHVRILILLSLFICAAYYFLKQVY